MAEISLELLIDSAKKEIIYMTCWYWRVKKKHGKNQATHVPFKNLQKHDDFFPHPNKKEKSSFMSPNTIVYNVHARIGFPVSTYYILFKYR